MSELHPFFSVVMPVYNGESYLKEALESVCAQTFAEWELLVIDDGSKDKSLQIAENFAKNEPRIKVLFHPNHQNKGVSASRNLGLERAKGEWISFLDADDYWVSQKLEREQELLANHPEIILFYSNTEIVHQYQSGQEKNIYGSGIAGELQQAFSKTLKGFHFHVSSTTINRTKCLNHHVKFNENFRFAEDTLFVHELLQFGDLYYLPETLSFFRFSDSSSTTTIPNDEKLMGRFRVYEQLLISGLPANNEAISSELVNTGFAKIWKSFLRHPFNKRKLFFQCTKRIWSNPKIRTAQKFASLFLPFKIGYNFIFKMVKT